jgi:hypothetical protein
MVIDLVAQPGWGAIKFALDFMSGQSPIHQNPFTRLRPWIVVSPPGPTSLYLPGLPNLFRQSAAEGRLRWVKTSEALAPVFSQLLLESSLCQGVLLHNVDNFSKSSPAAIWGRRWQLAARQGACDFIWVHKTSQASIGFDIKIEWSSKSNFEIKKGHGYFETRRPNNFEFGYKATG